MCFGCWRWTCHLPSYFRMVLSFLSLIFAVILLWSQSRRLWKVFHLLSFSKVLTMYIRKPVHFAKWMVSRCIYSTCKGKYGRSNIDGRQAAAWLLKRSVNNLLWSVNALESLKMLLLASSLAVSNLTRKLQALGHALTVSNTLGGWHCWHSQGSHWRASHWSRKVASWKKVTPNFPTFIVKHGPLIINGLASRRPQEGTYSNTKLGNFFLKVYTKTSSRCQILSKVLVTVFHFIFSRPGAGLTNPVHVQTLDLYLLIINYFPPSNIL